jgi:hypothetical protein
MPAETDGQDSSRAPESKGRRYTTWRPIAMDVSGSVMPADSLAISLSLRLLSCRGRHERALTTRCRCYLRRIHKALLQHRCAIAARPARSLQQPRFRPGICDAECIRARSIGACAWDRLGDLSGHAEDAPEMGLATASKAVVSTDLSLLVSLFRRDG